MMTFTLPRPAKLEINKWPSIPPTYTGEISLDDCQIHTGHWYKFESILKLVQLVNDSVPKYGVGKVPASSPFPAPVKLPPPPDVTIKSLCSKPPSQQIIHTSAQDGALPSVAIVIVDSADFRRISSPGFTRCTHSGPVACFHLELGR